MLQQNTTPNDPQYWKDARGHLVPANLVKDFDKLETQMVTKMMGYADELSAQIARFKAHCFDDVDAFMELLAGKYGKKKGGAKGNVSFTTFDGTMKVQIAIADHLTFGPELQIAKGLIDECISEWAANAGPEIRALVEHAFRTDGAGKVNRDAIFALRRLDIIDGRWQRAMTAIGDSIKIIGSKSYFRFYRRETPEAPWQAVTIDIAAA